MGDDERRRTQRHMHDDQVIVKLMSSHLGDIPVGTSWTCRSDDVSESGLRLSLESPVASGAMVDVCVISRAHTKTLLMTGVVRWCSKIEGFDYYQIGIDLNLVDSPDAADWPAFIASMKRG